MYDCVCSMSDYDGDPVSDYEQSTKVAKENIKCCECEDTIKKGESYTYDEWVLDGEEENSSTCSVCQSIWEDVSDGKMLGGYLRERLWDCHNIELNEVPGAGDPDEEAQIDDDDAAHREHERAKMERAARAKGVAHWSDPDESGGGA